MLIRVGYEVEFNSSAPTAMLLTLYLHPSRALTVRKPECLQVEPRLRLASTSIPLGTIAVAH